MTALQQWDEWEARNFPDDSGKPVPDPMLRDTVGVSAIDFLIGWFHPHPNPPQE